MNTAPQFALLAAPTYRSRAYVQAMRSAGLKPSSCILLAGKEPEWDGPAEVSVSLYEKETPVTFRPGEKLEESLSGLAIPVFRAPNMDVNDGAFLEWFAKIPEQVVVYSGVPGCILRPAILASGKRFLHAHGGIAPRYSGSTAFYFSLLEGRGTGATVFWMDAGLDTGEIVLRTRCANPQGVDIDTVFDPVMRGDALARALISLGFASTLSPASSARRVEGADESAEHRHIYHVMHPLLRHLVQLRYGLTTLPDLSAPGNWE